MNIFVIMVGTFLAAGILKNTKFSDTAKKGSQGEKIVNNFLKGKREGLLVSNLIIKENDTYTQIDHVYITDKAIFVIETKNHSGMIFGGEEDRQWTTVYGSKKFYMYNPLKQNETHVKMIRRALKDNNVCIIPITIFSNNKCVLKNAVKGVYSMEQFKFSFKQLISLGTSRINKAEYYSRLKKMNLSSSYYHQFKQVRFAKTHKKRNK